MIYCQGSKGFSIIELVVFIVVIAILSTILFSVFGTVFRTAADPSKQTIALNRAESLLDLLIAQKRLKGFHHFTNPCEDHQRLTLCRYAKLLSPQLPISNKRKRYTKLEVQGRTAHNTYKVILLARVGDDS